MLRAEGGPPDHTACLLLVITIETFKCSVQEAPLLSHLRLLSVMDDNSVFWSIVKFHDLEFPFCRHCGSPRLRKCMFFLTYQRYMKAHHIPVCTLSHMFSAVPHMAFANVLFLRCDDFVFDVFQLSNI